MERKAQTKISEIFQAFSTKMTRLTGSSTAFTMAFLVIILWGATGPLFHFSDTWQLAINTGTTIITFLMVFIIQQSQNKDTIAIHIKLNELIACTRNASNRLIDVEDLSEEELRVLEEFYIRLASLAKKERGLHKSHSIDEADENTVRKRQLHKNSDDLTAGESAN
ncbi:low affinity iron permease family protein [Danxiaibacter flavus]|uniref:Low affinity iron permease family protein n=1 Tax=Danxiaibacter flavus TaxID=3049108 RepID=A0ABV3ZKS8_9BACT|nr:low affinity iron permease family protein [Chitinophagaceae bacterium DXS]